MAQKKLHSYESDLSKILWCFWEFKEYGFEEFDSFFCEEEEPECKGFAAPPWSIRKVSRTSFQLYYNETPVCNYYSDNTFCINTEFDEDVYKDTRDVFKNVLNYEPKCLKDIKKDIAYLFSTFFQATETVHKIVV